MCSDPGTPGGMTQFVNNYEVGEVVTYKCLQDGYELNYTEPIVCRVKDDKTGVEWNSTARPTCVGELSVTRSVLKSDRCS